MHRYSKHSLILNFLANQPTKRKDKERGYPVILQHGNTEEVGLDISELSSKPKIGDEKIVT